MLFRSDLHKCWNFRGNRRDPYNPQNIFREVSTGLNGTPMPSYLETIKPDEAWDLVHYMQSLGPRQQKTQ